MASLCVCLHTQTPFGAGNLKLSLILGHFGCFWGRFGDFLGSFWGQFGVVLGSFCGPFGVILGSFWRHFGVVLGWFWGHFGAILADLTMFWGRFGVVLRSFWCGSRFVVFFGSCKCPKPVNFCQWTPSTHRSLNVMR